MTFEFHCSIFWFSDTSHPEKGSIIERLFSSIKLLREIIIDIFSFNVYTLEAFRESRKLKLMSLARVMDRGAKTLSSTQHAQKQVSPGVRARVPLQQQRGRAASSEQYVLIASREKEPVPGKPRHGH